MAIVFNDNFEIKAPRSIDKRYGKILGGKTVPYASVSEANSLVVKAYRHLGLTVRVGNDEYWWKEGIEDVNLVLKQTPVSDTPEAGGDDAFSTGGAKVLQDAITTEATARQNADIDLQDQINTKVDKEDAFSVKTKKGSDLIDGKELVDAQLKSIIFILVNSIILYPNDGFTEKEEGGFDLDEAVDASTKIVIAVQGNFNSTPADVAETAEAAMALALLGGTSSDADPTLDDFNVYPPDYVFSVFNTAVNGRQILSGIYIDNLLLQADDVFFEGGKNVVYVFNRNQNNLDVTSKQVKVIGDGFNSKSFSYNNISSKNDSAIGHKIMYMPFGDSITRNILLDKYNRDIEYWNYSPKAILNILLDRIDHANSIPTPLLLGHQYPQSREATYLGNSFQVKGGTEGIGSWSACNFLRHAMHLTSGTDLTSYNISGEVSYYLLGLKGQTGLDYTGTPVQKELIRTTIQGKHTVDYNATVWNYLKTLPGWGGGSGSWTDNPTNRGHIDTFLANKYDNPDNPFFSLAKAQTVGSTNAYSFSTYLSRYKTLTDDGLIRLVVGSTAGSKVTDVNAYDVCVPTHLTIELGENDRWWFNPTPNSVVMDIIEIANTIHAEFPAIKIGTVFNPWPGTLFPNRYPDIIVNERDLQINSFKADLDSITRTSLSSLEDQVLNNIFYIPTYKTFLPTSSLYDSVGYVADREILIMGSDKTHPGLMAAASMGDQIYAWIYYTLNL